MASTTGIELGRESCVLVGVRSSGPVTADVMALHTIEPGAWPTMDVALVEMLRGVRRGKNFPRNARIVAWGLHDDPAGNTEIVRALQRPIVAAGFRVESVITPPQALALLAASRPRHAGDGAVAWLALNMRGAAIAIVHDGELLFARTFEWTYKTAIMSGKAQLLQRYSLVAQLAPEVRRGIAAVRSGRGIMVEAAVTCGDLPDLRSLTMPLIEELDLEVETLDSTDGLRAVKKAKAERFAESAPAIRLACAAALAHSRQRPSATRWTAGVAAAIAVIAALGWGSYAYWRESGVATAPPQATAPRTPAPAAAQRQGGAPGATRPGNVTGAPQVVAQGPPAPQPAGGMAPVPGKATLPAVASGPGAAAGRSGAPATPAPLATPKPAGTPAGSAIVTAPAKPEPRPAAVPPAITEPRSTRPPVASAPSAEPRPIPKPVVTPVAPPPVRPAPIQPAVAAGSRKPADPTGAPRSAAPPAATAAPPRTPAPNPAQPVAPSVTGGASPRPAAPITTSVAPPRTVVPPPSSPAPRAATSPPPSVTPTRPAAATVTPPRVVTPPVETVAPPRIVTPPAPRVTPPRVAPPVASASPRAIEPPAAAVPAPRTVAPSASNAASRASRPPMPLGGPLPKVDSILIDQERRLAIVDGTIVMVGDAVGPRVVVQIDRDAVVLREPSGVSVRVALRAKM